MAETNLLGELLVKIKGDLTDLEKALKSGEKETEKSGKKMAKSVKEQFKEIDGLLNGYPSKMAKLFSNPIVLATSAIIALGKGFYDTTKDLVEYSSKIDDMSMRTGLSTDALQEWKYIAEQTGTTLESVTSAVGMMTRGLETNKDEYERLGIATKNANGTFRSTSEIFNDTISKLSDMSDETERDQLAFKLLGRSAQTLLPIFNNGTAAVEKIRSEAHSLGLVLSKETITNSDALGDAMLGLKSSLQSASRSMVTDMVPALLKIVTGLSNAISKTISAKEEIEALREASTLQVTSLNTNSLALKKLAEEQDRLRSSLAYLRPGMESTKKIIEDQIKANEELEKKLKLQRTELILMEKQKLKDAGATQRQADAALKKSESEAKAKEELDRSVKALDAYNKKQQLIIEAENRLSEGEKANLEVIGEVAQKRAEAERERLAQIERETEATKNAQSKILQTYADTGQTILSTMQGLFSQIQSLYNQDAQNRIDAINYSLTTDLQAIDARMQAELEAAGLSEATTIEELQKKLDAAIAQGELVTAEELRQEIARAEIKDKYEKEKDEREKKSALATYKVQLEQFKVNQKLSRAQAVIDTASAALKTATSVPWPFNLPLIAAMVALGSKQVGIINDQVPPSPPALASGGEIGANNPTLAVIGDNTRYNEVVAPLSPDTFAKIAEGILVALASRARPSGVTENTAGASMMYGSGSSSGSSMTVNAGIIVANDAGLRAFARVITPYLHEESVRIG